jgi:hypothetical protein
MNFINDTDNTITHNIVDEAGDPVDTTLLTGIVAKVFQKGIEIDKFSFNAQVGFGTIVKNAPFASGEIEFYINAEKLRQGIDSLDIFYEIKTEKANSNFDNNTEEKSTGAICLGKLKKTKLTDESFN